MPEPTAAPSYVAPASKRELFGHPFGLWTLSLTEMWERFSYYGMRALLVYYMTKYLLLQGQIEHVAGFGPFRAGLEWAFGPMSVQQLSSQIYGLYTGFVYLTPILGGWLADRYWGQRRTVLLGGVIMAAGEFTLMAPSLFLPGLLLLIVGNGFFKPNISTQVGGLYPPGDPRRDRAFNWFYVGVNVGAALAPLVCGTLGELYGWQYGFGAAGVGMLGGLVQYWYGQKYLAPDNVMKRAARLFPKDGEADPAVAEGGEITRVLVLPSLPTQEPFRSQSVQMLKERGVDGIISFRAMLQDLIEKIETNRNDRKSDTLQVMRILKNYDLLKDPQMDLLPPKTRP